MRCSSDSPMPISAPQHSSMPWSSTSRHVSRAPPRCGRSRRWGRTNGRSRGCGCSGGRPPSAKRRACSSVSRPALTPLRPVRSWTIGTSSRIRCMVRSSGPRTASTMQNSEAPAALVSSAARSTSSASRNGVALTGVSNRDDCEQKWQSSGQPPVLADRMPSTSTSGPHQASRPGGQSGQRGDVGIRECGQVGQLLAGQQASLLEQCGLGRVERPCRGGVDGGALGLTAAGQTRG